MEGEGVKVVTVLLGSLPGSGSGDWRPGFSLLSVANPMAPPSSVPLKAAFLRVVRTYVSFPGQLPGLCCPALGNPLVFLFGFFPGMPGEVLETQGLRAVPVRRLAWGSSHIVSVQPCVQRGF